MAQIAADRAEAAAPAKANPAPLGLSAFALTTFIAMSAAAGWYTPAATGGNALIGLALFYGGLGQILAGAWEFRNGNTFAGAAFSSYGGFWLAYGWALQNNQLANTSATGVGFYFLAWALFTFLWFLGTLRVNLALMAVFLFLTLTFLGLAITNFSGGSSTWAHISGYLGVITALLAWYTGAAGMLASTKSPVQLPTFPMG
jgi:uncharacterized protein